MESPLAFNQERRLLLEELARERSVRHSPFCIPLVFRLAGPLNEPALEAALNSIVDRHSALRTAFLRSPRVGSDERRVRLDAFARTGIFEPGLYVSAIRPPGDAPVRLHTLDAEGRGSMADRIHGVMDRELTRTFDYEKSPVLRAALLRDQSESVLVIVVSHLVADQWSLRVFERELAQLYAWHANSGDYPRDPACQYLDFVRTQHEYLQTPAGQMAIAYWERQWSAFGRDRALRRVVDDGAIPELPFEHAADIVTIGEERLKAIATFARQSKITLYMLLVATAALSLRQRANTPLVAMWTNLVNRTSQTENVIGWLTNSHLVAVDCPADLTVRQLLARVRDVVLEAIAHQAVPLAAVWRALGYRVPVRESMLLFDLIVDHADAPPGAASPTGVTMSRAAVPRAFVRSPVDLALQVFVGGRGLTLQAIYSISRFSSGASRDLLAAFMANLEWMLANASTSISQSPCFDDIRDGTAGRDAEDPASASAAATDECVDVLASQMDWGS